MIQVDKNQIWSGVVSMLRVNMGLKPGERLLVLADEPHGAQWKSMPPAILERMARRVLMCRAIAEIAREEFPECPVEFLAFPATGQHGAEPPKDVTERMKAMDVVVAPTTFSLSHTRARAEACAVGCRVATMPGFVPEMFAEDGPMAVDYKAIEADSAALAGKITSASEAFVESPSGTSIRFSVAGREGKADPGIYDKPGMWGNLPAGEAFVAPLEGTASGRVVVQKGWFANLDEDMVLEFDRGLVIAVSGGGETGSHFRELLGFVDGADPGSEPYVSRRNLAELGIGTNPNARRPEITLEAEKIKGTVHLAIGDGSHMGGRVSADLHHDFVIPQATLLLDGTPVLKNGKVTI